MRRDNPFFVLALSVTATRMEVERQGQKWLGMLELGLDAAKVYETPFGVESRTVDLVRSALAELRDPAKRLVHELWAQMPQTAASPGSEPLQWREGRRVAGYRP